MAGGQKRDLEIAQILRHPKFENVFVTLPSEARLHQPRGAGAGDNFVVRGDVIAVRMGDEGEWLRFPWIKPQRMIREFEPPGVADGNGAVHEVHLRRK